MVVHGARRLGAARLPIVTLAVQYPEGYVFRQRQEMRMASYDLICEHCGHVFEVFRQGFLRDQDKVCPECGATEVHQKFSSFLRHLGGASGGDCAPRTGMPFG
jgi:putative FmdB family regulatory protein